MFSNLPSPWPHIEKLGLRFRVYKSTHPATEGQWVVMFAFRKQVDDGTGEPWVVVKGIEDSLEKACLRLEKWLESAPAQVQQLKMIDKRQSLEKQL